MLSKLVVYLVEKVDFCGSVGGIARVLDKQRDQSDEGVQCVETLSAHKDRRRVVLLGQRPVAQVHAHLRAQTEEACYQVICLQNTVHIHLKYKIASSFRQKLIRT